MKCSILGTSNYSSDDELRKIKENMRELGFLDNEIFNSNNDYFNRWAGTPEERLNLFYDAWNSDSKAIFATRGGSGVAHFVNKIDFGKLKNKKLFVGYSDLTLLLTYLNKKLGVITLHGPMAMAELDYKSLYYLKKALSMQDYSVSFSSRSVFSLPVEKKIEGELIGGNLTRLIESLLYFHLDFKDKIVFLEEVGETEAKILNMLFTLSDYSSFKPKAIVFGYLGVETSKGFEDIVRGIFPKVPLVFDFPFGHDLPNIAMPIGALGELNFKENKLNIKFSEEHRKYAVGLDVDSSETPEEFKDFFYEDNRKNKLYPIPKKQQSIENVLKIYRSKNLVKSVKFPIREDYNILKISNRVKFNGRNYFLLEVERDGKVKSLFFTKDKNYFVPSLFQELKIKNPIVEKIGDNYYVMGEEGINYNMYRGSGLDNLVKIKTFSEKVQGINMILFQGKIGVFAKYEGKIHYFEVKSEEEIMEKSIANSEVILIFSRGNLGGISQVVLLSNGLFGVLGYTARKSKLGKNIFSYPSVFCFDSIGKRISSVRVILRRAELAESDSRKPEEYNVIMPGGITQKGKNRSLYLTVGNLHASSIKIKDPFSYYEKKF